MSLGNAFVQIDRRADNLLRYDPETITIPAGETREIASSVCTFVEILTATVDNAQVSFNGSFFFPLPAGLILPAPQGLAIRRLQIKNPGAAAVTYTIAKGVGEFIDNRLVLSSSSLLPVNPIPTAYSGINAASTAVASASTAVTVVAAGSNLNGILVNHYTLSCGADPLAVASFEDSANAIAQVVDSQAISGGGFTIPAGQALIRRTAGQCRTSIIYRLL